MNPRRLFLGVLAVLLLAAPAYAYQADVEVIPPGRYADVAVREIRQATASIHLTMYLIALSPTPRNSAVSVLVDALGAAAARGVDVRVVLDENYDWAGAGSRSVRGTSRKNAPAARVLQARGVHVSFDEAGTLTHAKVLVIDGRTVILGSTNWSEAALTKNVEANVLIRSEVVAQELLKDLETPTSQGPSPGGARSKDLAPATQGPVVRVPWAFLNRQAQLGRMVTAQDERAFDVYLLLLRTLGAQEGHKGIVVAESLRRAIGLGVRPGRNDRRAIQRVLRRLNDQYGVIAYTMVRGGDPVVSLAVIEGADDGAVEVPATYWDWSWSTTLTFAGKAMYLISLMETARSPTAPVWFRTTGDLAAPRGIQRRFVERGLMDLRRHNLVEVEPGRLHPADYADRDANRYTPNPLYDPKTVTQAFQALEQRYGAPRVRRVAGYLTKVYEDADVDAAERLLVLEDEFGPSVVRRAAAIVGAMSGNNPKKTVGYLIATIEGIGRRAQGRGD